MGPGLQDAVVLRVPLPAAGGWCTARSWTAPSASMLPTSRDTCPVPWMPSRTALPARQLTSARRPGCWWCYKGEPGHWGVKSSCLSHPYLSSCAANLEHTPHVYKQCPCYPSKDHLGIAQSMVTDEVACTQAFSLASTFSCVQEGVE